MPVADHPSPLDHQSLYPFDVTLARLEQAIVAAGMRLFATIDHAANARDAGLDMPASTVLIYGKAVGGTPIMLASPATALDLPLHVLVREGSDGRVIVSYRPIGPVLEAAGVEPALAASLKPAQDLLLKAIAP